MKQKPKIPTDVLVNANSAKPLRANGTVLESPGDKPMLLRSIGSRIRNAGQAAMKRFIRSPQKGDSDG